jgi:superfamily I DNA/RNA helicase/CRISPR/Cas system-associated exonuclease Cas4 (RecB family)
MTLDPEKIPIIEADIGATIKTVAGAGTGKTSVLVARYLRFVFDQGIPPDRLLALTFTIKAAAEMRTRIFADAARAERLDILRRLHTAWIMNFHQFAFRLVHENAASFGIDPGVGVAGDLDLARIWTRLYRRFETGRIEGFPIEYADDMPEPGRLRTTFEKWQAIVVKARGTLWTREGLLDSVGPEEEPAYRRIVESVAALWGAYEEELDRHGLIDFSDMIRIVAAGLRENPRLRKRYAEMFDHILVDEFQDTSEAQNEIVRLLSGGDFARVTVVGDDKQSIYRWRDARVQNLREFAGVEKFLRTNHRSKQGILDLAHQFIIADPYFASRADDIRLTAVRGASVEPICVFHPPDGSPKSFDLEARALAAWILSVTGRMGESSPYAYYRSARTGLDFGDIAVLMRGLTPSTGLPEFEAAFREAGIPYSVSGGGGSLEVRAFERLKDLVCLLVYPDDMRALLGVLENDPFALPDASLKELVAGSGGLHVDAVLSEENCAGLTSAEARDGCRRLRSLLHDLRLRRLTLDLPSFVSLALEEGPFYCHLFGEGADRRLVEAVTETLVYLVDRLVERSEANLAAFIEALQVAIDGRAIDERKGSAFDTGRVRVMTIHAAKGLQFPAVAVPGIKLPKEGGEGFHIAKETGLVLSEGEEWGRGLSDTESYASEKADGEQEERCLLYVAMTRARDHLYLSSPWPDGIDRREKENSFKLVLDSLRENPILYEEVRDVSGVDLRTYRGGGGEKRGDERVEESLVEEWSLERSRLDTARAAPPPAREIEFVTWRHLDAFVRCPLMYYYRYVTRMGFAPETDAEIRAPGADEAEEFTGDDHLPGGLDPKTYGSFIHRLLYEWMSRGASRAARFEDLAGDLAGRFGVSGARKSALQKTAVATLAAFDASDVGKKDAVYRLEEPVQTRIDRFVFRGTIDRIDRANGTLRVIDYKGKTPHEEYPYQVRFYAWLLRRAGFEVSDALLCYLARPISTSAVDVSQKKLDEIERDALRLEKASAEGRFDPAPGGACKGCDFRGMCAYAKR